MEFEFERTGNTQKLQLCEYNDGFVYKAYDANHALQNSTLGDNCAPVWGYALKVKTALNDEQKAALLNSTIKITVGTSSTLTGVDDRVEVWLSTTSIADGETAPGASKQNTVTLTANMLSKTDPVIYAGIYVHGNEGVSTYSFDSRDTGATKDFTFGVVIDNGTARS